MMTVPVLLAISTLSLVHAFVTHDFSVRYVAENSSLALPQVYTWVALYAGNAGSLLFIATIYSFLNHRCGGGVVAQAPLYGPLRDQRYGPRHVLLLGSHRLPCQPARTPRHRLHRTGRGSTRC